MKSDREILTEIYHDKQKEFMLSKIQNWLYTREYANPQKIGKQQAEDGMAAYQKNIKHVEDQLVAIKSFAESLGLEI